MTHIFYLISNICSIVAYDVINQISHSDRVVVILNRGCVFDVLKDKIECFDATERFKGYRNHLGSLWEVDTYKHLNAYKKYLRDAKCWLRDIINGEDFYLYLPNYAIEMCQMLARNKHCQGYYYLEEGTMAYMSITSIKKLNYDIKTRIGNVARFLLLGIRSSFQLEVTSKFAGTIALSNEAFQWNKQKEKRLIEGKGYLELKSRGLTFYDNCIIISYASYDIEVTLSAIDVAVNHITEVHTSDSIAIKLHPQSYFFYPDYASTLEEAIMKRYGGRVVILPIPYPVEASIMLNHSSIYSIFVRSSLSLYSLVMSNLETYLIDREMALTVIPDLKTYIAGTE